MTATTARTSTPGGVRAGARAVRRAVVAVAAAAGLAGVCAADPIVLPGFEGQFGTILKNGELVQATNFFVFADNLTEVPYTLRIVDSSGSAPENDTETPFVDLEKDSLHQTPNPIELDERTASYDEVDKGRPAVSPWLDLGDDLAGVMAFAEDGSDPSTQGVVVAIVPTQGGPDYVVLENIPRFPFPDENFNRTAVSADAQGNITVAFTEFSEPGGGVPKVRAQRLDKNGTLDGGFFDITDDPHTAPDLAILDVNGDALVIPTIDLGSGSIVGNILDTTGPTPVVGAEFPISGTPDLFHNRPAVAADVNTGAFTVVWENITGNQGDPVNIEARRFDADGNPIGPVFTVNTTTADAQGQPAVAYGPNGESAIVWASDPLPDGDQLDVFLQAYDASGQPIGGEMRVNTAVSGQQDRPQVRFLAEPDAQNRVQFTVSWRDVASDTDNTPNGTGQSYKCFSIDEGPPQIFADGFESGDTTSWSSTTQN